MTIRAASEQRSYFSLRHGCRGSACPGENLYGPQGGSRFMTGSIRRISIAAALLFSAFLLNGQSGLAASNGALDQFASAWSSLKGYNATIQLYEIKGANTEHATFTFAFTKPKNVTMNVNQGPNSGATVTWTGGTNVSASKSGAFGIRMSKIVSLDDPLVTSLRGYSVADLCFGGILM